MKTAGLPCSVIAIPVKNEAERVAVCFGAIACQRDAPPAAVVLLLNSCTDESAAIARQFAATSPLVIHSEHRALPASLASAGIARRLAMEWAADIVAPDGVILTTDADGMVPPDWLAANLAALRRADAVAGRAVISPEDAPMISARLHADDARECDYAALFDEIASVLDPAPHDPRPRHTEESGASIAVSAPIYRKAGGMPAVPHGEDRAFFAALRSVDARVRHAPEIAVTVSGRIVGRAKGGMSDTIRRRLEQPDEWLDDRLEGAVPAARRARLRRLAREGVAASALARALRLPAGIVEAALAAPMFGGGWADLEARSPTLARKAVPVSALAAETRRAVALLARLRHVPTRPPGMPATAMAPDFQPLPLDAVRAEAVLVSSAD